MDMDIHILEDDLTANPDRKILDARTAELGTIFTRRCVMMYDILKQFRYSLYSTVQLTERPAPGYKAQ